VRNPLKTNISSVISTDLLKVNLQFISTSFPNVRTYTYDSTTHMTRN